MTLNYNYPVLDAGDTNFDEDADTIREGGVKIIQTFETIFHNISVLEERDRRSNREEIRTYDFSLRVDYPHFGGENDAGAWLIRNITGANVTYANIGNNPTVLTLDDAWASRLTIMYSAVNDLVF